MGDLLARRRELESARAELLDRPDVALPGVPGHVVASSIAAGSEILSYLDEVIAEDDLAGAIRYHHRVTALSWSSAENRWTAQVTRTDTGETLSMTASFLWMCQGYYNHDEPYTPQWPGAEQYAFTEKGVELDSGEVIEADVVVTATGFDLAVFGDIPFTVDDEPVDFTRHVAWRGLMIDDVPNMAYAFGYFRHSWTLRIDLVNDLIARILNRMDERGHRVVVPTVATASRGPTCSTTSTGSSCRRPTSTTASGTADPDRPHTPRRPTVPRIPVSPASS